MITIHEKVHYNATKLALDSVIEKGFYRCAYPENIAKSIKELFDIDVKVSTGILLKTDYFDGNVHCDTTVIINHILHKVVKKYVYCNPSLNSYSWDTTEQKEICEVCFKLSERQEIVQVFEDIISDNQIKTESIFGNQLTLF
jgi:hypothetical protein